MLYSYELHAAFYTAMVYIITLSMLNIKAVLVPMYNGMQGQSRGKFPLQPDTLPFSYQFTTETCRLE